MYQYVFSAAGHRGTLAFRLTDKSGSYGYSLAKYGCYLAFPKFYSTACLPCGLRSHEARFQVTIDQRSPAVRSPSVTHDELVSAAARTQGRCAAVIKPLRHQERIKAALVSFKLPNQPHISTQLALDEQAPTSTTSHSSPPAQHNVRRSHPRRIRPLHAPQAPVYQGQCFLSSMLKQDVDECGQSRRTLRAASSSISS